MKRWLRRLFNKTPSYPVTVRKRPAPTEEDPRIAQKIERQRAWMKEQGINEVRAIIQRKPPKAVSGPQKARQKTVKRDGNRE